MQAKTCSNPLMSSYSIISTKHGKISIAYFEGYDNAIQAIGKRFQQEDFLIYRNTQDIFFKRCYWER